MAGYETGHEHGIVARNHFVEFAGELPRDMSDWNWRERETRARETLAELREEAVEPDVAAYSETYSRLKAHLVARRVLRALEEAEVFFRAVKNADAFWGCVRLLDRLRANRASVKAAKIPTDAAKADWTAIAQAAEDLIDEIRPADCPARDPVATESTSRAQPDRAQTHSSAAAYVTFKAEEVRNVVVENWRIPQTVIPGEYADTVNRIVRWFDNFAPTEYDDALVLLRNVRLQSVKDVDALIELIVAARLLRRHVQRRAEDHDGLREPCGLFLLAARAQRLGDPEVDDLDEVGVLATENEQVLRLDVAMDDALRVRGGEHRCGLRDHAEDPLLAELGLARETLREGLAVEVLHHHERPTVDGGAEVGDRDDVLVVDRRRELRFLLEALHDRFTLRVLLEQHLHGHALVDVRVRRFVDGLSLIHI